MSSTFFNFVEFNAAPKCESSSIIMKWQNCADFTTIRAKSQVLFRKLPKLCESTSLDQFCEVFSTYLKIFLDFRGRVRPARLNLRLVSLLVQKLLTTSPTCGILYTLKF